MGAGKSTLGQALAAQMDLPFNDLDDYIEQQAGRPVPEIFDQEGEQEFRKAERRALLAVIRSRKGIIALGGGTLQNQHLVDHVKVNGLLVFLDVPIDTILDRIAGSTHRPLLLDEDGALKSRERLREELQALYEQRRPLYEQAEVTLQAEQYNSLEERVGALLKKIRYHVALH